MDSQGEEIQYLEDYLKHTGWGLYYKLLVGVACACHFIRGVTFVAIAYAVALSSCDENFIPEINALRVFTCYLIGTGIGGLVGNSLSDRYGRKRFLTCSLMCIFFSSFAAAFAYNIYIVIASMLILGVGLETNAVQIRLLVVEVLKKEKRGFCITFCDMFWAIGYIFATFLVLLLKTPMFLDPKTTLSGNLTTWRIMFAASGGANLVMACVCAIIEESPRFYLYMDKKFLAYLLLKQLYAINSSDFAENFKVKEDDLKDLIKPYDLSYSEPSRYWDLFKKYLWRLWKSLKMIFSKRFWQVTWILILLKIPVIVIGLLQLNISLAKQLALEMAITDSHQKYRGLDFVHPVRQPLSYTSEEKSEQTNSMCQTNDNNSLFYKYLLLGAAIIPGQMLCMFIVDILGRKLVLCLLLASSSCLIIGFIQQKIVQTVAACIIIASIGGVISTITLVNLESYPTAVRGTSNAITSVPGYLFAAFFINLIVIHHHIFIIILGILYFCLAMFSFFLPETKGKPLVE